MLVINELVLLTMNDQSGTSNAFHSFLIIEALFYNHTEKRDKVPNHILNAGEGGKQYESA